VEEEPRLKKKRVNRAIAKHMGNTVLMSQKKTEEYITLRAVALQEA